MLRAYTHLVSKILDYLMPPPLASQIIQADGSRLLQVLGDEFDFGDRNDDLFHEVHIFSNAQVWPRFGAVMNECGGLVARTLYDTTRSERIRKNLRKYPSKKISGFVTSVEFLWSGSNHYHQLVDMHARLWSLRHSELAGIPVTLIHTFDWNENYKKLIRAIAPNILFRKVSERCVFQCDNYIYLPFLSKSLRPGLFEEVTSIGNLPEGFIEFHKTELGDIFPSNRVFSENLYVGRPTASKRRLKNESDLAKELDKIGFEFLDFSNLSLADQFGAFRRARKIVAIHGAGMANILAAQMRPWYLEIFPSESMLPRYLSPAADLGLINYDSICGDANHLDDDFTVSIDAVLAKISFEDQSVE
jgi:hypothetical protein